MTIEQERANSVEMRGETAQILDGKSVADKLRNELKSKVDEAIAKNQRPPGLAVVLIGDNPASQIYVKNKIQACKKVGIESRLCQFASDVALEEVLDSIIELNKMESIDGILVQLPLPNHLPTEKILDMVSPDKDVDGLHTHNLGLLLAGKTGLRPCTPQGIMVLLERSNIILDGKQAVVIGRSSLVGKPLALMLLEKNATVTICHSRSQGLNLLARAADVLIVAAGKKHLVDGAWIKPGAVVVDVGIHRCVLPSGETEVVGDVDFKDAVKVASFITPVPGGVGPMTVTMLLSNCLSAYQEHMISKG